ncbi:MAG TPA: von Willebrand factor type A domain-containing protein [Puia sp.]|nr:von Willebrand factor type A domain-containing protein [Puia sp.]
MRYVLFCLFALVVFVTAFRPLQDFTITGIVKDQNGFPLADVTVTEAQSHRSTITGEDGSFTLKVLTTHVRLMFRLTGYDHLDFSPADITKPVIIRLNASIQSLKEVEVRGYKTEEKKDVVGSVTYMNGAVYGVDVHSKRTNGFYHKERIKDRGTADKKYFQNKYDSTAFNTEEYDAIIENRFLAATENPLSTFSIDVDGGSYSNVRRYLQEGQLPPSGAVRIEELINYFHYEYPQPTGDNPFSINTEIGECAWNPQHKLVMIGLQGKKIPVENLPASNLVFLIDVSGSMMEPEKLPLVQRSLSMLVDQLREQDRVSLVVYAGNAGLVMPSTSGFEKKKIKDAIERLEAGGSTAGGAGIQLAYKVAEQHFVKGGNNRVILCTDGDFNVGPSSDSDLLNMIEKEKKSGVFLTVLGFGMGNYKDSKMEKLADRGNGNHAYIDNENEARKVLVNEFGGTLFTIAKDVKLQIEFNPAFVQAYRLIGYENRMLNKEDFNNDSKDAGELGSGHTVTALYEVIPVGVKNEFSESVDPLKYQKKMKPLESFSGNEIMNIKFRYKTPDGEKSKLIEHALVYQPREVNETSVNFRFVSAVAEFGMVLRNSAFKQQSSFERAYAMAKNSLDKDSEGYRAEFLQLIRDAGRITKNEKPFEEDAVSGIK